MIIREEQRGLVYGREGLKKVLLSGRHGVSPFDRVEVYSANEQFEPRSSSLEAALSHPALRDQLELVEVPDNHIVLHWVNGNLSGVLSPGKAAFWKGLTQHRFQLIDLDQTETTEPVDRSVLLNDDVRNYVLSYSVEPYQQGLLFIDKVFVRVIGAGNWFFWKGTKSVSVEKVDLRHQQLEVTGQEIMSKDKVPIRLNVFCQYCVIDIKKASIEVKEPEKQLYVLLQLALREYIGSLSLDELLEKKEDVGRVVAHGLASPSAALGLEIGHVGIKDIILPGEIRDIMNQVLIAEKKAQANVITRREETASTRSLLNTAKLMEENEILYRLKELEYVERISAQITQISLGGGTQILDQLRELFLPKEKKK